MAGQLFIESQLSIVSLNRMESLKCASFVLRIRIYRSELLMKFRECDSINSKENIQEGYRNGPRIVN